MRRWIAIALLAFFSQILVLAQDQPDTSMRKITKQAALAYPELARRLNIEGTVKLHVIVAPDGTPKRTEVVGGNPVLVNAAQDCVMRWTWVAAPRESTENVELRFHGR